MTVIVVTPAERRRLLERDGGCVMGPGGCAGILTVGHRINKGSGGSSTRDGFAFWVVQCIAHNTRLESDAPLAAVGRRLGWKLESWEDVYQVAVFSSLWGGWRLLDGVGGFLAVDARDREERDRLNADRYADWRTQ
jgi:hypothetical protein